MMTTLFNTVYYLEEYPYMGDIEFQKNICNQIYNQFQWYRGALVQGNLWVEYDYWHIFFIELWSSEL